MIQSEPPALEQRQEVGLQADPSDEDDTGQPNQPPQHPQQEYEEDHHDNESWSNRGETYEDDTEILSPRSSSNEEYQSVDSSTKYGSVNDEPWTRDPDDAFLHNPDLISISSMSPRSRASLERHFQTSSSDSLETNSMTWDHSSDLLADLTFHDTNDDPDDDTIVDEVFESSARSSTPRRITRKPSLIG